MTAGGGQVVPGITVEQIEKINTDVPGRGPHTVTGPIYVNDAQPGDVVKIHINKIKMRDYATNNSSSTGGLFPEIFEPKVDSYYLDTEKMQMKFEPNIVVPLAPRIASSRRTPMRQQLLTYRRRIPPSSGSGPRRTLT